MRSPSGESRSNLTTDPTAAFWFPEYNPAISLIQDTTNWGFGLTSRYELDMGLGIAGSWRLNSGYLWAPIHRVDLPRVGTQPIFLEDINSNRSDRVSQVDLRADYSFPITGNARISVMADLYNVFNANPETNFIMRTGGSYNDIIEWLQGRSFKIGARFQF
jgi:outer membrane receptor protein involved in Fe transport